MAKVMRFLVFQHVPHEHLGLIKHWANTHNVEVDIVELWKKYTIPSLKNYNALVIMGGPMGVYENYPSEKDEIVTIKKALGKIPIIGFCLGSQLLAHALGTKVYPNVKNGKRAKEIGYMTVNLTNEGKQDRLLKGFSSPMQVLQWHGDAFDLPKGAKRLATSALCSNQAFVYKNAYGFLFHFEFTPDMIAKQIKIDRSWMHTDYEIDEQQLLKQSKKLAPLMKKQCYRLFDNSLSLLLKNGKNSNTT